MIYLFNLLGMDPNGLLYGLFKKYITTTDQLRAFVPFIIGILICTIIPYLLGSLNFAIIISKYKYNDDIRKYASGNAGLTNMHRVYGKKGALLTLGGDMLKQFISIIVGIIVFGENGAYIAGTFCMLGHIAPVYYRFKGGKGVLTAATMILLIDPKIFLILLLTFVLVVLIFRYISLASMAAAFIYPALVYYRPILEIGEPPSMFSMIFSCFIGLMIIFMHRENMRRLYNNEESRFSFKKKSNKEQIEVSKQLEEPEKSVKRKKKKDDNNK